MALRRPGPEASRRLTKGSMVGAGVLLAIALFLIVNYFGWKYHLRGDWTESRLYTLSQKSEQVLEGLSEPIRVTVLMDASDPLFDPTQELLARYEAGTERVQLTTVDPARNPAAAQGLVDRLQLARGNVVVFEQGEDRRVVEAADLAEYDYSGMQYGAGPELTAFKGEQEFTGAILALSEGQKPRILFTTGHGEASLDDTGAAGLSSIADLLGRDNFQLDEWASLGQAAVPEDADLVVVAGPTAAFTPPELAAFTGFLERGGRMLVMLDPELSGGAVAGSGLEEWLAGYGVQVHDDIVIDPENPVPFFGAESFFVQSFGDHAVTEALRDAGYPVVLSLARSLETTDALVEEVTATALLTSGGSAWGETDLEALRQVEQGEQDLAGPLTLAVALDMEAAVDSEAEAATAAELGDGAETESPPTADVAASAGEPEAAAEASPPGYRLAVFGDSDWARNGQIGSVGNPTLVANTMNWLVERSQLLGIPPREPEQTQLNLTRSQVRWLFWLVLAILPGLAVIAGVVVTLRRRR